MKLSGTFRSRTLAREWLAGTFLNLGSSITTEIAGQMGYDWMILDYEHGPGDETTMMHQLQAAAATPTAPLIRIAANETPRFKRVLDAGAHGVMVPYISTEAEARAAVASLRDPPRGIRGVAKLNRGAGYGLDFEEYYQHAHEWLVLAAQVETPEAVANIDAIAAVDGIDVLFVGPNDLTYNLGIREQFEHPRYLEALDRVVAAARKAGKAAGILLFNPALLEKCRAQGFTFVAFGSDGNAVMSGLRQSINLLRGKK